jgi:CheY-like chemotaxis protein
MPYMNLARELSIQSIILADDDRDDHDFFRDALSQIDPHINLTTVENGDELLSLLKHYIPDFIFLDLDMPGKNGLECLKSIKNNEVLDKIPVVIFSSTSRPANIDTAYEMGADLFFIKPSNYNDLVSSVGAILKLDWSRPHEVKEKYFINNRFVAFL